MQKKAACGLLFCACDLCGAFLGLTGLNDCQ